MCYTLDMTKVIEAIFSHGVLEPLEALELPEQQRVRLTIEPVMFASPVEQTADRKEAMQRLLESLQNSTFSHGGPYPTRDELHER
jgi:predicted DNA-binding antitoxin AbrB/MazE fold protein